MIRLGILGTSPREHGPSFAGLLKDMPEVKLVSVWDYEKANAVEFAKKYGMEYAEDAPEDMLGHVDAALVTVHGAPPGPGQAAGETPSDHMRFSKIFLEAGKPLFLTKPFADKIEDARGMVELSRRTGTPLMSCSTLRYAPEVVTLRQRILDNQLGNPRTAFATIRAGGRLTLAYYGIHGAELVHYLLGPGAESVYAEARYSDFQGRLLPDTFVVLARYVDGKIAMFQLIEETSYAGYHVAVYGDKGYGEAVPLISSPPIFYIPGLRAFINMVKTGIEPIPLEHTLEIAEILIAGQRSIETKSRVYLRDL